MASSEKVFFRTGTYVRNLRSKTSLECSLIKLRYRIDFEWISMLAILDFDCWKTPAKSDSDACLPRVSDTLPAGVVSVGKFSL